MCGAKPGESESSCQGILWIPLPANAYCKSVMHFDGVFVDLAIMFLESQMFCSGTEYLDHLEIFTSKPLWWSECRGKTVPFGAEIDCVGYNASGAEMREFERCLLKNREAIGWLGFWSELESCTLIRLSVTLILEPLIWVIWIWKFVKTEHIARFKTKKMWSTVFISFTNTEAYR